MNRRSLLKSLPGVAGLLAIEAPTVVSAPLTPQLDRILIEDALRLVGALMPGQMASKDDLEYCGRVGARMIAGWGLSPRTRTLCPLQFEDLVVKELAREIAPVYSPYDVDLSYSLLCVMPSPVQAMVSHRDLVYVACADGHIYAVHGSGDLTRLTCRNGDSLFTPRPGRP